MNHILKGNICYSKTSQKLNIMPNSYLVCESGLAKGVFPKIPEKYRDFPVTDYNDHIIIPGLCDLHLHAPQFFNRGIGMDMELLDWLNKYTFPEEAKYAEIEFAEKAYTIFANELRNSATTRASIYATLHVPATTLLMEKLEGSGLITMVGKVNMDINSPDFLREENAQTAYNATRSWIESTTGRFKNTTTILTPRFIPACSEKLLAKLGELQKEYALPVQSHLSESRAEIAWVKELFPKSNSYGEVYAQFGLFGGNRMPTIMAHCVWSEEAEEELLKQNGVYVAHCPQSNENLSSGIAPIRRFLDNGVKVGLATDISGGCHLSILRAMSDAIRVSKLRWRLVAPNEAPLTMEEAFYLGTIGSGSFFGKVGSFEEGYEFDAVIIDDSKIAATTQPTLEERLSRIIYLSEECSIIAKYIKGTVL